MVLPHSHATQVTDGLEKARGMAETTRLPRVSLGGRLKMFPKEPLKGFSQAAPASSVGMWHGGCARGSALTPLDAHAATGSSCSRVRSGLCGALRADFLSWKAGSLPSEPGGGIKH